MAKYKVVINSSDNLRDLLQESYILADQQLTQAQNEINKMANSTNLQEAVMAEKQQYCKAINDYLGIKDKAISKKLEIAKLLSEIIKHNGDINEAVNESSKNMSFDFSKIREVVNREVKKDKTETITLKKTN